MQDRPADVGPGETFKRDARSRVVALGSSQQAHQSHLHQIINRFGAELGVVEGNRSDQQPVLEQQLIAPLVAAQRMMFDHGIRNELTSARPSTAGSVNREITERGLCLPLIQGQQPRP